MQDLGPSFLRGLAACVQVDGDDVRRVAGGVRYEDHGTNVETTPHSIPEFAVSDLTFAFYLA